jgi:hypothetical protein
MDCSLSFRGRWRAGRRWSLASAWGGGVFAVGDVAFTGDGAAGVVVLLNERALFMIVILSCGDGFSAGVRPAASPG